MNDEDSLDQILNILLGEWGAEPAYEQDQIAKAQAALLKWRDEAVVAELKNLELPITTKKNKNGMYRGFSIAPNPTWKYSDIYVKGERNYRGKVKAIIKDRIKQLEADK